MIIVGKDSILVYPCLGKDILKINGSNIKTVNSVTTRGIEFKVCNGHVVPPGIDEEFFMKVLQIFSGCNKYEVQVDKRKGIKYSFQKFKMKVKKGKLFLGDMEIKSIKDAEKISSAEKHINVEKDNILVGGEKAVVSVSDNFVHVDVQTGWVYPKKYMVPVPFVVNGGYEIETGAGKRKIPFKPAFFDVLELEFMKGEEITPEFEYIRAIPNHKVRVGNVTVKYVSPVNWTIKHEDGTIFCRVGDELYVYRGDAVEINGIGGKFYVEKELPTGQKPAAVWLKDGTARLYGIVTPEGVFVIDVPAERLQERRPISVFEEGVKIVGTLLVFPKSIPFDGSGFSIITDFKTLFKITIDGLSTEFEVKEVSENLGKKVIEMLVGKENIDLASEYGVKI